jgi:hypothetical protein
MRGVRAPRPHAQCVGSPTHATSEQTFTRRPVVVRTGELAGYGIGGAVSEFGISILGSLTLAATQAKLHSRSNRRLAHVVTGAARGAPAPITPPLHCGVSA